MLHLCHRQRARGGALLKLVLFMVILGAVVVLAWVHFLPALLTNTLERRTGFTVLVKDLMFNPFEGRVELEGFTILNPQSFPRADFIEITTFIAEADTGTLFTDHPVINRAQIEVNAVALIRSADGTLNAKLFNDRLFPKPKPETEKEPASSKPSSSSASSKTPGGKAPTPTPTRKPTPTPVPAKAAPVVEAPPLQFLIKHLQLRLNKIIVEDHTGNRTILRSYDINFVQSYENVTDTKQLLTAPFMKSLTPVGNAITGLIPGYMGKTIDAATNTGSDMFQEATKKNPDAFKGFMDTLEDSKKP